MLNNVCNLSIAAVTAIKPERVSLTTHDEFSTTSPSPLSDTKGKNHPARKVQNFKGIGIPNGSVDTGFVKTDNITQRGTVAPEKQGSIKLSPGMQKFVDGAGKTIKNINQKALDIVKKPLSMVGLEAESAKLRPAHGGVGLGVSIKLNKNKKSVSGDQAPSSSNSQEFYDLIKPDETSKTY